MSKARAVALEDQPPVVLTLLAVVLVVNMFLFAVAYSSASFHGVERAVPDPFAPSKISMQFDNGISIIADNLRWSTSTAIAIMQPKIVAFLGLEGYQFGATAPHPAVLGASIVNPDYADSVSGSSLAVQAIPTLNEFSAQMGSLFAQ